MSIIANEDHTTQYPIPEVQRNFNYRLTIAFLGFGEIPINQSYLEEQLPTWHAPILRSPSQYQGYAIKHVNFSLSYSFSHIENSHLQDYKNLLESRSMMDLSPYFSKTLFSDYMSTDTVNYHLKENVITEDSPTLLFINTYGGNLSEHEPFFYYSPPYIYNHPSSWGIAGGGMDHRLIWMDLSAGPSKYYDESNWVNPDPTNGVNESLIPPIWSYNFEESGISDLHDDLSIYIQTAVETKFLPSYTVSPSSPTQEVHFEYIILDAGDPSINHFHYFDEKHIMESYTAVNPDINWTYASREWDWTQDSGYVSLLDNYDVTTRLYDHNDFVRFLDSRYLGIISRSNDSHYVVPIFLLVLPSDLGMLAGGWSQDLKGKHAYIFVWTNSIRYQQIVGLISIDTNIVMHEIGHAIGLNHPFDGYSWHRPVSYYNYQYWLWDFTHTQMSYAGIYSNVAKMDIDTLQRAAILNYGEHVRYELKLMLREHNSTLSDASFSLYQDFIDVFDETFSLYEEIDDPENYEKSLHKMMSTFQILEELRISLEISNSSIDNSRGSRFAVDSLWVLVIIPYILLRSLIRRNKS